MIPRPETSTPDSLLAFDPAEWSSRRAWENACRLFAGEHRGALPEVDAVLDAERPSAPDPLASTEYRTHLRREEVRASRATMAVLGRPERHSAEAVQTARAERRRAQQGRRAQHGQQA